MYSRKFGDDELQFEASGGLIHASLVMMDKQSDSYWSLMEGKSLAGKYRGTALQELPFGEKMQWKDWIGKHPDTKVLSIEGETHVDNNPYDNYFSSENGFRGSIAQDERLPTKEPIYAFELGEKAFAVPFSGFVDGGAFQVGEEHLFLYRPQGVEIFHSSAAYRSRAGFEQRDGRWIEKGSGAVFDLESQTFRSGSEAVEVQHLGGFDTFWFNWSMSRPRTEIVR